MEQKYQSSDERYAEAEKRAHIANRKAETILNHPTATTEELAMMMDEVTTFSEMQDEVQDRRRRRLGFLGLFRGRAQ